MKYDCSFTEPLPVFISESVGGEMWGFIYIWAMLINNLKFSNDTVTMADNIEDLYILLNRVYQECKKLGLTINSEKLNSW